MNEAEWLATDDVEAVIETCRPEALLKPHTPNMHRIDRLLATAFARRARLYGHPGPLSLEAIEFSAQFAEGEAAITEIRMEAPQLNGEPGGYVVLDVFLLGPYHTAGSAIDFAKKFGLNDEGAAQERKYQCALARCVYGNPFRRVFVYPACLRWNDRTVARIAQAIYADQDFGLMPILADALEESGCSDAEILKHLRGPGPHIRGCYALDMLAEKLRPAMRWA